jgi:hypothetical protein
VHHLPPLAVRPLHSYRATLVPADVLPDEVEFKAAQGLLPTLRLKSTDAEKAMADAHRVTGKGVLRVERIDPADQDEADEEATL